MKYKITALIIVLLLVEMTQLSSQNWVRYHFIYPDFVPKIDSTYIGEGIRLTSNNPNYRSFWESYTFTMFDNESFSKLEDYYRNSPNWNVSYIKICEFSFANKFLKDSFIKDLQQKYSWTSLFITLPDDEMTADDDVEDDDFLHSDSVIPNDSFYQSNQEYLKSIKCEEAWNFIRENNINMDTVNVGIVDSNFSEHEDYVMYQLFGSNNNGNFHGNNVMGCLAAQTNNGIGIAAPCMNYARVFVFANDSNLLKNKLKTIHKLIYENKCKVVNCSFSSSRWDNTLDSIMTSYMMQDCIIICSAGNNSSDSLRYPASFRNCMSVTGVDCSSQNFGKHFNSNLNKCFNHNHLVDISAPGYYIYTTDLGPNSYDFVNGTSFSAPLVASVATLVRAVNPCLTANEVIDILKSTANDTIYQIEANEPYRGMLGTGLVDAYQAVKKAYELSLPRICIRDSQQDDGTEPYQGNDYFNSPDIIVRNEDGSLFRGDLSSIQDNYLLDVIIRNFGCNYQPNENTKLIVTIDAASLVSKFSNNDSFFCNRIFESTNVGFTVNSGVTVDSIVIERIPFRAPAAFWGLRLDESFSSEFCTHLPLEHVKLGFNIMATLDEEGSASRYLRSHFRNDSRYVKAHRNAAMKKGREKISMDKFVRLTQFTPSEIPSSLVIRQKYQSDSTILSNNAEVYLWLSDDLIPYIEDVDRLDFVDENRVLITNRNTEINFLPTYNPENRYYVLGLEVHFFGDEEPQHSIYDVDIELVEEGEVSDAITFTAIRDESVYFNAVASISDSEIMNTQETTLSSNRINNNASYTWFDAAMDTIGRGRQLTVQPDRSQTYTLKIQQESNGYVASDTVSVVVKEGRISAITPNPATMSAMISYEVTPNKSASITITDISNTIRQNYPINQANGTLTIPVNNMPKGVYYVTLNVEGAVADTKSLIVQ